MNIAFEDKLPGFNPMSLASLQCECVKCYHPLLLAFSYQKKMESSRFFIIELL